MAREPIAVLLLPARLEELAERKTAGELLRGPGVVAVEPGRLPFAQTPRAARGQAKRLLRRLPGRPVAVVVFGERQWALARELTARVQGSEALDAAAIEPGTLRARLTALGVALSPRS